MDFLWLRPAAFVILGAVVMGLLGAGWYMLYHAKWRGAVDADRSTFKKFMDEVRDDIKKILGRLPPAVVEGHSPLRLNDLGKIVSEEIDARAWADRIVPTVSNKLENHEAFEIQDFCFVYVTQMEYSEQENRAIRKSAYENAISVEQVQRVLAIELRDKLLAIEGLEAP